MVGKWKCGGMGASSGGTAREVEVDLPHIQVTVKGRVVNLKASSTDPCAPDFKVELLDPKDADLFVSEQSWWTLEDGRFLKCAVLGKPFVPAELFPMQHRDLFPHGFAVKRGPSGFLPHYGPKVLGAAVSAAFNREEEEPAPISHKHPFKINISQHLESKWGPEYTEDGIHHEELQKERMAFMMTVDGHGGDAITRICLEYAPRLFKDALEQHPSQSRERRIRLALKQMVRTLDVLCQVQAKEVEARNRESGAQALLDAFLGKTPKPQEKDEEPAPKRAKKHKKKALPTTPTAPPKYESCAGAVACFAVLDLQEGVAHTATVGDCFAFVRIREGGGKCEQITGEHSADSPQEQARFLLEGGFVSGGGDAPRSFGVYMPSRALGECDFKALRPEIARCMRPEPLVERFVLDPQKHTHFGVATDGLCARGQKLSAEKSEYRDSLAHTWFSDLRSYNWDDRALVVAELVWEA